MEEAAIVSRIAEANSHQLMKSQPTSQQGFFLWTNWQTDSNLYGNVKELHYIILKMNAFAGETSS